MNKFILVLITAVAMASCKQQSREVEVADFNKDWRFQLSDIPAAKDTSFQDVHWRKLDLPHDWSIEGPFDEKNPAGFGGGALPGGIGWYRKTFYIDEKHRDQLVSVLFDGVYRNSEIWINGHYLGKRPNGYISFQYDLTPHLVYGKKKNVLAVKVDNAQQPNSRWYSGSGIYRHVHLLIGDKIHVAPWGVQVTTPEVTDKSAKVLIRSTVVNETGKNSKVTLTTILVNDEKKEIGKLISEVDLKKGASQTIEQKIVILNPELWSIERPVLYSVVSHTEVDGVITDSQETLFGIRYFLFDSQEGFSLNGEPVKIKGVCMHHDLGCLGTAVNKRAIERQLEILKGMGVNAIRTSHNPPAPELLDLCDRMGFLVMDEAFDIWKREKTKFDYHLDWDQWHVRDLEDHIKRDRNHPSVFVWSIGNEISEQWDRTDSAGSFIARELVGIVKRNDDTRPVTAACNNAQKDNPIIRSGALDLIGFNYANNQLPNFPVDFPGKKFIGTETTSALETRGHYDMPSDSIRVWPLSWDKLFLEGNPDNSVSAYDNVRTPWGSTHEEVWKTFKRYKFLSGMFIWTGFDYIGEPTPYVWPSRSSYFGIVDLAGFPKDVYYMYKSEWTNEPVLHVFPHWNWKEGQTIDVWAYYNNADEVELFLNDKSLGVKKKIGDDLHIMWRVPFTPGTLRAVSRKSGQEVLTKEIKTAGLPRKIVLEPDRTELLGNTEDLSFITVKIVDENGTVVPAATTDVTFTIEGQGSLAGVDNGDPVSHASFQANHRQAFHGLCLAVVRETGVGVITVKASSPGLQDASITLTVK